MDQVAIHFGTPEEQWLSRLSPELAVNYASAGHFGEGSMQPKVEAILDFLRERPTAAGLITSPACIAAALERRSGTWIENDGPRDAEAASNTNKEKQS